MPADYERANRSLESLEDAKLCRALDQGSAGLSPE